jgi:acetyl esterase/lipase
MSRPSTPVAPICAAALTALLAVTRVHAQTWPGVNVLPDIVYNQGAADAPQLADLYLPQTPPAGPMPAVVLIHGGEWKKGSKEDGNIQLMAATLAQAGMAALAINYTLYDPHTKIGSWPQNLQDSKTAVQWLRVNAGQYGIDTTEIGVAGTSAGAQLAALVAMTDAGHGGLEPTAPYPGVSTAVQAAWLMYCPCTAISTPWKTAPFLGKGATQATETAATPDTYVRPGLPPIILNHGSWDTLVPILQSIQFHAELAAVGTLPGPGQVDWKSGLYITYPTTPGFIQMDELSHGFNIYDPHVDRFDYDLRPNLTAFFQQYLPLHIGSPG